MTFAELKTEVFRRLRESSSTPVFWTEADVEGSINEGYGEISDSSEWYERVRIVNILKNQSYYDVYSFLDKCFLRVDVAFNETTNRWMRHSHHSDLDSSDRRWEMHTGEPEHLLFRGIRWLGYWPYKSTEAGTIRQYYIAIPPVLCADTDFPGFPEQFHYGLVEFALYDLWSQDNETALALTAYESYSSYDAQLTQWVNKRLSIPERMGNAPSAFGS